MRTLLFALLFLLLSINVFGQETTQKNRPTDADKIAEFDSDGMILRGAALGDSEMASLAKVMNDPGKFAGRSVMVEGVIVRSCKMEGCWMELATSMDSARSVRVKFKDHGFFIPLKSEGFLARAEGVFSVKVLGKEEVDHLIEDGAKFDERNEDGSVTEISLLASGVELKKAE